MNYVTSPISAQELIKIYREKKTNIYDNEKITFLGVEGFDVYNITKEFQFKGKSIIAGRVEKRDTEVCKVVLFEKVDKSTYSYINGAEIDLLQDPCVSFYNGDLVIGGTEIFVDKETDKITSWCTSFYRFTDFTQFTKVGQSPLGMKDVRFIQDGDSLHVFTRPQGLIGGLGKIGYIKLSKLEDLTPENLDKATILKNHFTDDNWGGVNDIHLLKNGMLGAVAHISMKTGVDDLHYYPCVFVFNPETKESTQIKILLERSNLKDGPSKYPRLKDVIFTGGIIRHNDGKASLYMGTSDCEAQFALIDDPFLEYER